MIALLVLTGLVLSGLISSARSNRGYSEVMNHSVAAQANSISLAQERNGIALTSLMTELPLLTRAQITRAFDDLVYRTQVEAQAASIMGGGGASHNAGQRFAQIQSERAQGVAMIRRAIDGALGLEPFAVIGAPVSNQTTISALNQTQAASLGASAGALIQRADLSMASLKAALRSSPGQVRLRNTTFVADPSIFSVASMTSLLGRLSSTPALAPTISLSLLGVTFTPAPLPTTNTTGVVSESPTTSLGVTAIVANHGNAIARGTTLAISVSARSLATPAIAHAVGTVDAGGSLALSTPLVAVVPGSLVTVRMSVRSPGSGLPLVRSYRVSIAQATPSPPTTSTG